MKKLLVTFLLISLSLAGLSAAEAQDSLARISGMVYGESDIVNLQGRGMPLPGSVVQVFFERGEKLDSAYAVASQTGKFSFRDIPAGRVVMRIQSLGYKTRSGVFDLSPGENAFLLMMEMQKEELEEAKVEADVPLIKQLQDTTFYNTAAVSPM